MNKITI